MPQSWQISDTDEEIIFGEAPPVGVDNIVVTELPDGGGGATDVWAFGAFSDAFGWPSEVEYFADRLFFACTDLEPQAVWASCIGDYFRFTRSVPLQDDDPVTFRINARSLNQIRDLVPLDHLLPMTSAGQYKLTTGADDVVTPSTVGFKPQGSFGASHLPALVVGGSAIYVQEVGQLVREIAYNFAAGEAGGYEAGDLTKFARHLVRGHTLVDRCYAAAPLGVVLYVRDDGKLLALTRDRAEEVCGWTPLDTRGAFETVCSVPEDGQHVVYAGVRRTIGGETKRYIETFDNRQFERIEEAFFVDSGLTYDGRNTSETTLTLTGGDTWDVGEVLTLTASADLFDGDGDIGDQIVFEHTTEQYDAYDELVTVTESVRLQIVSAISATEVEVQPLGVVPEDLRDTAVADWIFARNVIAGLDHLEGEEVAILSDGSEQARQVVIGGQITLVQPGGLVHVGLPYRAEGESLDLNFPSAETIRDRAKAISKVGLQVERTRGLKAGPNRDLLNEVKQREFEVYGEPTRMVTDTIEIDTESAWDKNGRFVFVQDGPLPASLLALIPVVHVGGRS